MCPLPGRKASSSARGLVLPAGRVVPPVYSRPSSAEIHNAGENKNERSTLKRRELLAAPVAPATSTCGRTRRQTTGPFFLLYDQVDKDVDLIVRG